MTNFKRIAQKNDLLRTTFFPLLGRVIATRSVAESPDREEILEAVRSFNDFTPYNDPHGEHDFGKVVVRGEPYFWKIDYYDADYRYFQEDGNRVLTIMRASEY